MKNKKNVFKTFIAVLLAGACTFSVSCKKPDNGSVRPSDDGGVFDPDAKITVKDTYDGTHDFTAPDTDMPFVTNGSCDYTIVVPETRGAQVNMAKNELVQFFAEATGINLPAVADSEFTDNGKGYISLGETSLLAESGVTVDHKKLTEDGVRIVTEGKNIYLVGGGDYGTLYAVYDFLEIYFDFDVYYKDCYEINKNVKNLKLKNFNVTDIPDLEFRSNGYYQLVKDEWMYRFRVPRTYGTITFPIYEVVGDPSSSARGVHNSLNWLPKSQFYADHPDWYNNGATELCYTAHGNKDEYEKMMQACVDKAVATLTLYNKEDYPYLRILNFTQQDNYDGCACATCSANVAKYGTNSATLILFMNDLRTRIDAAMAEMDEKYRRDDMTLTFFAYLYTETAPDAKFSEMHLKDGVSVFLATSATFDHQSSIYADSNTEGRENLKNWGKLSNEILLWTYSTKFSHYMYPVDTYNFYGEDAYTFFAANNVKLMYNQSQVTQKGTSTAWHNLKAYLDSKLEWDGTRDSAYYTEKYINAMFGEAAPVMKEIYTAMRLQAGIVKTKYNGVSLLSNVTDLENPSFWPYFTLKQWLAKYDEAYAALETYRLSDPTAYNLYKSHIDAEYLSPAYMTLVLYKDMLSAGEAAVIKDRFREAVKVTGITNVRETGSNQIGSFVNGL